MTVTDFIVFFLSILFLIRGAIRGFMYSLTVPFSIIVATIISIIYYQTTKDIITSLTLGLICPLILNLLLKFLLKILIKTTTNIKQPRFLSRLGGAILTFIWWWVFIIFTLILLALPPWGQTLTTVHDDVSNSSSYIYIAKPLGKILFTSEASSSDAKSLAEDPRFQKILQDPDIQKEIDAHDIVKLMSDPKMMDLVQQIMSDPAAMKKVFSLYNSHTQPQQNNSDIYKFPTAKNP